MAFWRASSKIRSASRSPSAHGMGKRSTSSCTAPGRRGAPPIGSDLAAAGLAVRFSALQRALGAWCAEYLPALQTSDHHPGQPISVAVPFGFRLAAVSYTHLTLPTTPYV